MTDQQFDGDGQRVKSTQRRYDDPTDQWVTDSVTYYLNSTVLGGRVVTELTGQGTKQRTYVYAGQTVLAWQSVASNGTQSVAWEHRDASGASFRMTDASGTFTGQSAELDPVGANAGLFKPLSWPPPRSTGQLISFRGFEDMDLAGGGCTLDRMPIPCGIFNDLMEAGAVISEYPNRKARDPNQPLHHTGPDRWVPLQMPILNHGLGLFEMWVPPEFRVDRYDGRVLFVIPQNRSRVPFPSMDAIRNRLNSGDCNAYIAKLLAKAGELYGGAGNAPVAKDGLDLLNKISNQGGFVLQDPVRVNGYSVRNPQQPDRGWSGCEPISTPANGPHYKIAYGWGPGPTADIRTAYADDASSLRNLYAPFLNCLKTGQ
jgi:hypothetical protein